LYFSNVMKNSKKQIGFTILALVILILMQAVTVLRIYKLETDKFDTEYRELIINGLDLFEEAKPGIGLDVAHDNLDLQTKRLFEYYKFGKASDTLGFRKITLKLIQEDFEKNQEMDVLIQKILQNKKVKTKFKVHILFHKIEFDGYSDTLSIYNETIDSDWEYVDDLRIPDGALSVKRVNHWGSYYSCNYELLIDFAEKEKMVLGQIAGMMAIMLVALFVIGFIFITMLRNMLEERRLSLLKTDFINNMTHELKTPLSTIAIATKSLRNSDFASDMEKVIGTAKVIGRQNKQLSKQINHLLEVSMWERQQFDLDKRWVVLGDFLHDLVEAFKWECKDSDMTIIQDCKIDPKLEVFLDETQITTALHNLLINAVKYTDKKPEISLSCEYTDQIILIIKDNGIGMSKDNAKHVFEKFYRVHTGNIHKVKGLGLGLFYVRQIIEAHRGTIQLVSKLKKGSTFTIKIPSNGRSNNSTG
jgi:two-component system, OmpR family, phosphate regulon sensor histidine kinase PhoR